MKSVLCILGRGLPQTQRTELHNTTRFTTATSTCPFLTRSLLAVRPSTHACSLCLVATISSIKDRIPGENLIKHTADIAHNKKHKDTHIRTYANILQRHTNTHRPRRTSCSVYTEIGSQCHSQQLFLGPAAAFLELCRSFALGSAIACRTFSLSQRLASRPKHAGETSAYFATPRRCRSDAAPSAGDRILRAP